MMPPTRRSLLGMAAGASALALGMPAFADRGAAYTNSTTFTTASSIDVTAEWRSEYNGTVVESRDTGATIPLDVDGVLPGDSGKLVFRLTAQTDDGSPTKLTASLSDGDPNTVDVVTNAENGRNQPELDAGDTTPDTGELLDAVDARAWYDVGAFGVSFLGGCDGNADATEAIVEGTLGEVIAEIAGEEGIPLPESGCLAEDEAVCFGIEWWIDTSVGNSIQGDSVSFPLTITATTCEQ